jgi:hypothetical protein
LEHAFLTLKHLAYAQEIDIFYTQLGSAMEARVQHALQIIAASDYSKTGSARVKAIKLIPFHMNYSIIISCINCWSCAATAVSHVDNGPVHRIASNCLIKSSSNYILPLSDLSAFNLLWIMCVMQQHMLIKSL